MKKSYLIILCLICPIVTFADDYCSTLVANGPSTRWNYVNNTNLCSLSLQMSAESQSNNIKIIDGIYAKECGAFPIKIKIENGTCSDNKITLNLDKVGQWTLTLISNTQLVLNGYTYNKE